MPTKEELDYLTSTAFAVLTKVLGPKLAKQTFETMTTDALLSEPETTQHQLRTIFENAPPIDDESIEEFAAPRMKDYNVVLRKVIASSELLRKRPARDMLRFLRRNARHVDRRRLEDLKYQALFEVLVPADALPKMLMDPRCRFEKVVRDSARTLRESIEHFYKSLVQFLVDVTCRERGVPFPQGDKPIGTWMMIARNKWDPTGGPVSVLDHELRVLRNALDHQRLKFDIETQRLRSPLDSSKWISREQYARLVHGAYYKLLSLWFVLVAWTYENEQVDVQSQPSV